MRYVAFLTLLTLWQLGPGHSTGVQGAPGSLPAGLPFRVDIIHTDLPGVGEFHRPVLTVGTNEFYFMAPQGFRVEANSELRRVYMEVPDGRASITLRLRPDLSVPLSPLPVVPPTVPVPTLHDAFREPLLRQYPGGRILEEYELRADGLPGATFDLDWKTPTGLGLRIRVCYVPTSVGVFEFVLLVDPGLITEFHGAFNNVLTTFRFVPPGTKLKMPTIPSRS